MKLKDKVAIVTGSTRGIGRSIAELFLKEGAKVVINGTDQNKCDEAAKQLGKNAIGIKADISKSEEINQMIKKTIEKFGKIDILVNNAGIVHFDPFFELSEDQWDKLMDVDLKGTFLCSQKVAKEMVKRGNGGKIINISSVAGFIGFPRLCHYCAAKAGVAELTKEIAIELAPYKINVNSIAPGIIETDMTKDMIKDTKSLKQLLSRIPLGRVGKPEEIAKVALFLASDDSSYMTGTTVFVDGGWLTE